MAKSTKLFNQYRENQKGLKVGLTYDGWLESKILNCENSSTCANIGCNNVISRYCEQCNKSRVKF